MNKSRSYKVWSSGGHPGTGSIPSCGSRSQIPALPDRNILPIQKPSSSKWYFQQWQACSISAGLGSKTLPIIQKEEAAKLPLYQVPEQSEEVCLFLPSNTDSYISKLNVPYNH